MALLLRAGGGQNFGDGGGGGGSLSGGGSSGFFGGGHFLFFGGGAGAAAGGVAVLLVAGALAVVIFTVVAPRMRGISGSGSPPPEPPPPQGGWSHSDQPAISTVSGDLFPGTAAAASRGETLSEGLSAIAAHDPAFDRDAFLQQTQTTFFLVQEAWTKRKPEMSRQVMADGLWQQHRVQIQGYLDSHKRNVLENLSVADVRMLSAHSDSSYDTISVRIVAAGADYDVDDSSGKVVRGDKSVTTWSEDWTFQRSSKATTKVDSGTMSSKCPNCGAPLDLDIAGVCKYCKAPISSGAHDWVLARISQVPGSY